MKRLIPIAALGVALVWVSEPWAQHPRPAAGGGGHPGGGGQPSGGGHYSAPARPAHAASPSFSHAQPAYHPPSGGRGYVPSAHASGYRPSGAGRTQPSVGGTQTYRQNVDRAQINRANVNRGNVARPNVDVNRQTFNRETINRNQLNQRSIQQNFNRDTINRNQLNQRSTQKNFNARGWNAYARDRSFYRGNEADLRGFRGGAWNGLGYWNRPWRGDRPYWYWNRPWAWSHWGWHHGYWNWTWALPAFWLGGTGYMGWPDTFAYANPYYLADANYAPAYDYSTPIPAPTDQTAALPVAPDQDSDEDVQGAPPPDQPQDPNVQAANQDLDAARDAFKNGDYAKALELVDKGIALLPSDATLHEFRALTLFAQQRYQDAAATLYAVLAAGPGWNWDTMISMYPSADTYTQQLRALEAYQRTNANFAPAHFLLAYHYLVLGEKDAAVRQLQQVVRLGPKDELSAQLLKALTQPSPGPSAPPSSSGPGGQPSSVP